MLIGVIGRANNKVSVVDLSEPVEGVMQAIGSDVTVPEAPAALFIRENAKGAFVYAVTDTSFSAINLNLPKGPSATLLPENTLTLGNGPTFAAINSKGTLAYIVNNQKDLYLVDLSTPAKPKVISKQTLLWPCGYCALAKDEKTIFLVMTKPDAGGALEHATIAQFEIAADGSVMMGIPEDKIPKYYTHSKCLSSFVAGETSKVVYAAGGLCLDMVDLQKEDQKTPTLTVTSSIVALVPFSQDDYGVFVAYGSILMYVYYNEIIMSLRLYEPIGALAIDDKSSSVFIAPLGPASTLTQVDTDTQELFGMEVILPWADRYICLAVQTITGGLVGYPGTPSAPNPKPPTKPKPSKPPKKCPKKCCKKKKCC